MTIESTLERIATALEHIAKSLPAGASAIPADVRPVPIQPQPQQPAPAPVPVPQFAQPAPAQGAPAYPKSPFTDGNSVMAYCVEKYRTLGPVKGAEIQTILASMGHTNIATLRVDQYDEFYFRSEGIR